MAGLSRWQDERSLDASPDSQASEVLESALRAFEHRGAFAFSSHPDRCCRIAREWFAGLARAHQALDGDCLAWIREYRGWGPHAWPFHWCEIAETLKIDCGAHAA